MNVLEKLTRQTVRVGSGPECEVRLTGPRIPELAAIVVHRGDGRLAFVPEVDDLCSVDGRPLVAAEMVPFQFDSSFVIAGTELPVAHPDLSLMTMSRGHLRFDPERITFGRDPKQCHIVMNSPGVSARHLSVEGETVIDHHSTSGTWLEGHRLAADTPSRVSTQAVLAVGPLPLPMHLARQLHEELSSAGQAPSRATTQALTMQTEARSVASKPRHRTVMGTVKMMAAAEHGIGRTNDNDIILDSPQVSSRHAKLINLSGKLFVEDLGSELGTFVRGSRIKPGQRAHVDDGEQLRFGPVAATLNVRGDRIDLVIEDQEDWAGRPLFEIEAANVSVVVRDRDDPRSTKTIVDDVSFKALPGDLIALMGPSGSGKTTLLHALTGYLHPARGEVRVNGQPLADTFDALRGSIGYVPQDDIVHPELTVREAVTYSARFRLPPDYSSEEIDERVETTLRQLGLESVADLLIGRPEQKVLSGGQRKRVNIAMELVTDPALMFLDEPTSGLASDDTTALIELLRSLARDLGKTIVATIHQPARDEYEKFSMALLLGHGGVPLYFGPTGRAYEFFEAWRAPSERRGLESPRDLFAELGEREARLRQTMPRADRSQVRQAVARAFRTDYQHHPVRDELEAGGRGVGAAGGQPRTLPQRERPKGQLRLLLSRYLRIKLRDRVGTTILLLQAPVIGVLLALVFGLQRPAIPYWCLGALNQLARQQSQVSPDDLTRSLEPTPDNAAALFFLVVAAVWFGTSNAAREIVSERAIFRRERMVNLGTLNYALSKFLVLGALCVLQCTVLLSVVFWTLGLAGGVSAFVSSVGLLSMTAICSVALGLLLSAVVASSEAAMALTPIALIPQVVLGGLMVPATTNQWLVWPMKLMPSRWGFEGVIRRERLAVADLPAWNVALPDVRDSPPDFIEGGHFRCALAQMQSADLSGAWAFGAGPEAGWMPVIILTAMTLVLLAAVVGVLKRQD